MYAQKCREFPYLLTNTDMAAFKHFKFKLLMTFVCFTEPQAGNN